MDIEHIVRDYLRAHEHDAQYRTPATIEPGLVTVEAMSGSGSDRWVRAQVVNMECWHESRGKANALAEAVYHDLLSGLAGELEVTGVEPDTAPHPFDDPDMLPRLHRAECSVLVYLNESR